jgi:hypothetical protein
MEYSFSQSRPILKFVSLVIFSLEIGIQINQTITKVDLNREDRQQDFNGLTKERNYVYRSDYYYHHRSADGF